MTVDELNRRYGSPGRIVFHAGHGGHPNVVLANKYGSAEVALLGGNVLDYRPTGHGPVLFRPAKRDYARGDSVHGGIPVCWPQFGGLAIEGMMGHGFAKLMVFDVRGSVYSEDMTEVTLGIRSSDATRELWPHDFDLELRITLSMKLNLRLVTKNTGREPFDFTAGFHPYLRVRGRDEAAVRGVEGCDYVFADDMSTHVQTGDLAMTKPTNHVFSLPPAAKHEFALLDAGLKRAIAVVASGITKLVVWNPGPSDKFTDLAADDWRKFVCVEPVTDWPKPTIPLKPGETHELLAAVQAHLDIAACSEHS